VTGVDSTTAKSAGSPASGRIAYFHFATLAVYAFVAVLAALIVFGAFATPGFLSISNLSAILTSAAFVGIIAVGSTLIMLSGSLFSISLGTTTAITGLTNGTGYFFTVASVDAGGTSAPSSEASASPVAPSSGSSHGGGSLSGNTLLALLLLAVLRFFDPRFSLRKPVTRGRLPL